MRKQVKGYLEVMEVIRSFLGAGVGEGFLGVFVRPYSTVLTEIRKEKLLVAAGRVFGTTADPTAALADAMEQADSSDDEGSGTGM